MGTANNLLTFEGKEIIPVETVFNFLDTLKSSTNDGIFIHEDDIKNILDENDFVTFWATEQHGDNPALMGMEYFIENMPIKNISGYIFYFFMPLKASFEKLAVAMDALTRKIHHEIPVVFGTITNQQLPDDTIRLTAITPVKEKAPMVAVNNLH